MELIPVSRLGVRPDWVRESGRTLGCEMFALVAAMFFAVFIPGSRVAAWGPPHQIGILLSIQQQIWALETVPPFVVPKTGPDRDEFALFVTLDLLNVCETCLRPVVGAVHVSSYRRRCT
ncbi:MAG: hypothetical protein NXI28_22930, partial [bacterium]|nr:hypothetical protein [bacterium]